MKKAKNIETAIQLVDDDNGNKEIANNGGFDLITGNAETFKKALELENEKRKLLKKYIKDNLTENVDYGKIHISESCQYKWTPAECKNPSHWSKPCLFKPGSEKFCNLLQLRDTYKTDVETLEMLPEGVKKNGVIALVCELINRNTGQVVSEGRGACTLQEKSGNINTAIKITKKRAKIDAVLSLGLSDTFTQDLDDMPKINNAQEIKKNESRDKQTNQKAKSEDEQVKIGLVNEFRGLFGSIKFPAKDKKLKEQVMKFFDNIDKCSIDNLTKTINDLKAYQKNLNGDK